MYPMDFFENAPAVKGGHCFVAMPFASELNEVFSAIKAALQVENLDVIPHRADEIVGGGPVMDDVLRNLAEAELVIVDVSGNNPNVFYELGIAHTVRCAQSVLLITQTIKDVPFDVKSYRCIEYTLNQSGLTQLQDKLVRFLKEEILPTRFVFKLGEGETGKSDKVTGNDRFQYSFEICEVSLARDSVQFLLNVFLHRSDLPPERVESETILGLKPEGTVPIPRIPWALKFHGVEVKTSQAMFCVCKPDPVQPGR